MDDFRYNLVLCDVEWVSLEEASGGGGEWASYLSPSPTQPTGRGSCNKVASRSLGSLTGPCKTFNFLTTLRFKIMAIASCPWWALVWVGPCF